LNSTSKQTQRSVSLKESLSLSLDVLETLKERGINLETISLQQLIPKTLNEFGCDLSLMSGAEWVILRDGQPPNS